MDGIMVDNWFMDEVLFSMPANSMHCSKAYATLLEAIILWDQLYYPYNIRSVWSKNETPLKHLLSPIDDWNEEGLEEAIKAFSRTVNQQKLSLSPFSSQIVGAGAIRYVALSAKNGLDYLPCSSRQEYLKNHLSPREFGGLLSQLKAQGFIDSLISDQISNTIRSFLGSTDFFIEVPALAQYIINNTPPDMTPAEFAFHLREEGPVIKYRQYLKELSNAFNADDVIELGYLQSLSKEVVSDVFSVGKGRLKRARFKLFPNFSFSTSTNIGDFGIAISPLGISGIWEITAQTFTRKNLTFLTDMTYCVTEDYRKNRSHQSSI